MSSQAELQRKNIEEYLKRPLVSPAVLQEMRRQHDYANTIDPDAAKEACRILNQR